MEAWITIQPPFFMSRQQPNLNDVSDRIAFIKKLTFKVAVIGCSRLQN
jgi:hypothetical protein